MRSYRKPLEKLAEASAAIENTANPERSGFPYKNRTDYLAEAISALSEAHIALSEISESDSNTIETSEAAEKIAVAQTAIKTAESISLENSEFLNLLETAYHTAGEASEKLLAVSRAHHLAADKKRRTATRKTVSAFPI